MADGDRSWFVAMELMAEELSFALDQACAAMLIQQEITCELGLGLTASPPEEDCTAQVRVLQENLQQLDALLVARTTELQVRVLNNDAHLARKLQRCDDRCERDRDFDYQVRYWSRRHDVTPYEGELQEIESLRKKIQPLLQPFLVVQPAPSSSENRADTVKPLAPAPQLRVPRLPHYGVASSSNTPVSSSDMATSLLRSVLPTPFGQCMGCLEDVAEQKSTSGSLLFGCQFTCGHGFCEDCLIRWVEAALENRQHHFPLKCSHPECKEPIDIGNSILMTILNQPGAHKRTEQTLLAQVELATIHSMFKDPIYCPNKKCDAIFEAPEPPDEPVQGWEVTFCEVCKVKMCLSCRCYYHDNMSCEAYQKLPLSERAAEDVSLHRLASDQHWRRCPNCNAFVEKRDGCNHVKCLCGTDFCYVCSTAYKSTVANQQNPHGEPGCRCQLFDVPEEEPPLQQQPVDEGFHIPQGGPRGGPRIGIQYVFYNRHRYPYGHLPEWLLDAWRRMQCHYCGRGFSSLRALDAHQSNTTLHRVLSCCGRTFANQDDFNGHLQHHR